MGSPFLSTLRRLGEFDRLLERFDLQTTALTEPGVVEARFIGATELVVDHERDRVERLPPAALGEFRTRLRLHDRNRSFGVPRHRSGDFDGDRFVGGDDQLVVGLLHRGDREDRLEVVFQRTVVVLLRAQEERHFLVLRELVVGDAERFLDRLRIEFRAVGDLHHALGLTAERKRQRVVADHTDGGEANVDRLTEAVGIGEQQIRFDAVVLEHRERILYLGECPNDLTVLERAGGVHVHVTGVNEFVEELECFGVLARNPVVGHHIQNGVVGRTNQCGMTDVHALAIDGGKRRYLFDGPVELGCLEHLFG